MIVVDTNVIAYALLPSGDQTEAARRALARDRAWAAPVLWRSEFRNVLALNIRHRRLAIAEAIAGFQEAEAMLAGREYTVDATLVLALSVESGRTAYDCEFVTVAQTLEVPLVTSDRQVLASFPGVAVSLREYAA